MRASGSATSGLADLRKELMEEAGRFYEGFIRRVGDDMRLRLDLARASLRAAQIEAEVGDKPRCRRALRAGPGDPPRRADPPGRSRPRGGPRAGAEPGPAGRPAPRTGPDPRGRGRFG